MLRIVLTTCALIAVSWSSTLADDGVGSKKILLGQSCALSGPAAALGSGMRTGLLAAFQEFNQAGGWNGKRIELETLDDGYEPDRAIENTRSLLEKGVFSLIGEVGTPTSKAVYPIVEEEKIPFFGPFTGAEFLRNPFKRYVVNVRGSYFQEMERLAQYLVDEKGMKRVACFYQNDGYGKVGLTGIENALQRRGMELYATGHYERNTTAVRAGLLQIRKSKPQAVIMVGAYKPCATFIKVARRIKLDAVFCNISFVGTDALKSELGEAGEGCIISQVVKFPYDTSTPIVAEYTSALAAFDSSAKPGFVSLEGYMVGRLFCETLKNVRGELTRESFLDTLDRTGTFDMGGVTLEFSGTDHQGMDEVFLTEIRDGQIVEIP